MGRKKDIYGFNGKLKRKVICANMEWHNEDEYGRKILEMYINDKMSSCEISEYINDNIPNYVSITPRSIQRAIKKYGMMLYGEDVTRPIKEAFNNAIKRDRIKWVYKDNKLKRHAFTHGLRYKILKRDKFKCVKCGATAKNDLLEVDHIKPLSKGGLNDPSNLQTLCRSCNFGKLDN